MKPQETNNFIVQIQGISAEMLLQRFDSLEKQIKELKSQQQPAPDRLISRDETAKMLGVSIVTIHNWVKSDVLKAYKVGNKVRFKESELFSSLKQIDARK
jgi:excisionase family DNA binding protein